ncbi:MAG: hypothetical protein ACOYMM_03720 [Phycisphaerales bacterium]
MSKHAFFREEKPMARRGTPALYELMGRGRESKTTPVIPVAASARKPGPTRGVTPVGSSGGTSGGGSGKATASASSAPAIAIDPALLRVLAIGAGVIVLLLGVYWLGVSRGTSNAQNGADQGGGQMQAADAGTDASTTSGVTSGAALAQQSASQQGAPSGGASPGTSKTSGAAGSTGATPGQAGQAQANKAARSSENQAGRGAAPVDPTLGPALPPAQRGIDPRQAGLHYCVIASVLEANADKLVQFCRDRGLDAWVVPDHNGRLREITVLPGIPKSELKGELAKSLEARILKVGALWKAAGRGNSDFEDRYFKPFNG